jgi:TonB family protein
MNTARHETRYHSLADGPRRSRPFAISFITQSIGLVLVLHFGVVQPRAFLPRPHYQVTELVVPAARPAPVASLDLPEPPRRTLERIITPKLPSPPPPPQQSPRNEPQYALAPVPPPTQPAPPQFPSAAPQQPQGNGSPQRAVALNSFASGSSAAPTLHKPAREVQTGGFGDPNGVPANANARGPANIAQLGSFDLPAGPGVGNGTGGARGSQGTVVSAGFGDGVAGPGGSGHGSGLGNGGSVRDGGFSDNTVTARPSAKVVPVDEGSVVPAEVLSKPTPVYSDEARRERIEGEVLLEVEFDASGKVRVLRVLHGLGHGLDEAAIRAAQQIRFKPAQRGGHPVNSVGRLHILFQLA